MCFVFFRSWNFHLELGNKLAIYEDHLLRKNKQQMNEGYHQLYTHVCHVIITNVPQVSLSNKKWFKFWPHKLVRNQVED